MLFDAIEFAVRAHAGQYRKGSRVPYIVHPMRVSTLLIEAGASEQLATAGVLHDTVEDTDITLSEIERRFDAVVSALVEAVTEPDRAAPWEVRKSDTIQRLSIVSDEALLLACADKLDNVRSMRRGEILLGAGFWERFSRPKELQADYYRSITAAIEARAGVAPIETMVKDLRAEVRRLFDAAAATR